MSDVDAITNVIIKAMPLDPQWDYRFPLRYEYPDDHYKYTRMLFELFLDPTHNDWCVMVVEDALEPDCETMIVAFGVWDVSYANKRQYGPDYQTQDRKSRPRNSLPAEGANLLFGSLTRRVIAVTEVEEQGGSTRKDANHEHFDAFWKGQIRAYKTYFGSIGPTRSTSRSSPRYLTISAEGHGTSLCRWAMELVRKEGLQDMTVMASPMGYELYTWLGFETISTFIIQVPGENERLTLVAMMYRPGV